jgi:hypothetical protein
MSHTDGAVPGLLFSQVIWLPDPSHGAALAGAAEMTLSSAAVRMMGKANAMGFRADTPCRVTMPPRYSI